MAEKLSSNEVKDLSTEAGTVTSASLHNATIEDDKALEAKVTRKVDMRVVPMLCALNWRLVAHTPDARRLRRGQSRRCPPLEARAMGSAAPSDNIQSHLNTCGHQKSQVRARRTRPQATLQATSAALPTDLASLTADIMRLS